MAGAWNLLRILARRVKMLTGPIACGTIRTSTVLGLRLLVQAGTLLLVARVLGPDEYGVFAGVAALAFLLGTLSTFGTNLVLFEDVSRDRGRRNEILSYAIAVALICGAFLSIAFFFIASWLISDADVSLSVLLALCITEVILQPFLGLMATEHHALGRIARAQLLAAVPMVLRLLAAICIFLFDLPSALNYYAAGYLIASVLALALGTYYLPQPWPDWQSWRLPKRIEWRKSLNYASINISKVGSTELDKTLALKLLTLELAGIYAAAARVISAITLPVSAMTLSALPRLFRESRTHKESTQYLLQWMYGGGLIYSLCLAGGLWLVAPVLSTLFSEDYHRIQEAFRWLCLAIPGITLRLIAGNALMAMGKPWQRAGFEVVGLIVLVASSIIFTRNLGFIGMPLALVCAELSMAFIGGLLVIRNRIKAREVEMSV